LSREFKSALKAAKLSLNSYKDNIDQYRWLSLSYLLNDQYDNAKEIFLEWKNELWPGTAEFPMYNDLFLSDISFFESIGITHPDFD